MTKESDAFTEFIRPLTFEALYAESPRRRSQARRTIVEAAHRFATTETQDTIWSKAHCIYKMAAGEIQAPRLRPDGSLLLERNKPVYHTLKFDLRFSGLQRLVELCPIRRISDWALLQLFRVVQDFDELARLFREHTEKVPDVILERFSKEFPREHERQWALQKLQERREKTQKRSHGTINKAGARKAFGTHNPPAFFFFPKFQEPEENDPLN